MSRDPTPEAGNLGTFSTLPLELRERIYGIVLNLNNSVNPSKPTSSFSTFEPLTHHHGCTCGHQPAKHLPPKKPTAPILALLLVSKAIYSEARPILFQTNSWKIEIEDDDIGSERTENPNKSIMNLPGWKMHFSHSSHGRRHRFNEDQLQAMDEGDMWAELRFVHLSIGGGRGNHGSGILEYDILPWKRQTKQGPERPSFVPLLKKVDEVVQVLDHCRQLHFLRISLRSIEKTPGNMEMVLSPLRKLRSVKKSDVVVVGMQDDLWVDWSLKGSYGRYLDKILGMPRGAEAPKYVGDEKEPDQNDKEIYDMIGARWKGGLEFAYPPGDGDIDGAELFDDFEAEMEEFDEFMEYMGLDPQMMGFGLVDPYGWGPEEDENEADYDDEYSDAFSDEEDEDEDFDESDSGESEFTDDEMPALVSFEHYGDNSEGPSEDDDSDDEMPGLMPLDSTPVYPQPMTDSDDEMPDLIPLGSNPSSSSQHTAENLDQSFSEFPNAPIIRHLLMRDFSPDDADDDTETDLNPLINSTHPYFIRNFIARGRGGG